MTLTRTAAAFAAVPVVASALVAPATAATPSATGAAVPLAATTAWYDGVCRGTDARTGTSVIVDFRQLDGNAGLAAPKIVRCSRNTTGVRRTALKVLQDAGVSVTGTAQWGLAFVCRLNGRPTATEPLPILGNPGAKEACVQTPPSSAYWGSFFGTGYDRTWRYATSPAASRYVTPGGFEGWAYQLNVVKPIPPRAVPLNPAVAPLVRLGKSDADGVIRLGQSVALTWSTARTTKRLAAIAPLRGGGAWSGLLATRGRKIVKPTKRGTYLYVVNGYGGARSKAVASVRIVVK